MAIRFAAEDGSYSKDIPDSGDGQSKAKFGNPITKPTDNLKKPSQTIEKPTYSGDNDDSHSNP